MHSHHSHSGQYVAHATNSLEEMISVAESKGYTHFCLTEHMPRLESEFLYPEELELEYTTNRLDDKFQAYLDHASRVQQQYLDKKGMKVLVGFEVEGIDESHIAYAAKLLSNPVINMCVGSVHFVHLIPIDFNHELWLQARDKTVEKTTRGLYKQYFKTLYQVISTLKPEVIGHFDLIRLFEPVDEVDPTTSKKLQQIDIEQDWPDIWEVIIKTIEFANNYGALFELNSAAIRKGWNSPYPKKDLAVTIDKLGGKFCFSDDSHAVSQVGLNYHKVLEYINELQLKDIYYLDIDEAKKVSVKSIPIAELNNSLFWNQYK